MRVEREVKIPAKVVKTEAKVKKVLTVSCDICNSKIDLSKDNRYGSGMSQCCLCKRDICRTVKAGRYGDGTCYQMYDNGSDYWDKYCIICYPLYIPAMRALQERHWKEEEKLEAKIKKESLAWQNHVKQ